MYDLRVIVAVVVLHQLDIRTCTAEIVHKLCGHTSSLCQTFARLSSPGEKWIVSCHPCSGGERVGRGRGREGGGRERREGEGGVV